MNKFVEIKIAVTADSPNANSDCFPSKAFDEPMHADHTDVCPNDSIYLEPLTMLVLDAITRERSARYYDEFMDSKVGTLREIHASRLEWAMALSGFLAWVKYD